MKITLEQINKIRQETGFLTIDEILQLTKHDNILLDPFSLLISKNVHIGEKNIFYPNVVIQTSNKGAIEIGNSNVFFINTSISANKSTITIGEKNQFGEGGCTINASGENMTLTIKNEGRYANGPVIIGNNYLGSGSQILGNIIVQNCKLEDGDSYQHTNPDLRGAVLKGAGIAKNIFLEKGNVINTYGMFHLAPIEKQSTYH